jgi:CysZ protein
MIIESARAAATDMTRPEFRSTLLKSLGLTLLALAALWFGLRELFAAFAWPWFDAFLPGLPAWAGWVGLVASIVAGIGLALALALLVAPVTALVASLFLDDIAELIERSSYPGDAPGTALPAARAAWLSAKFFAVVVLANLVALILLLVPGINIVAFFIVNAWLLGREFFEFAAMRFLPEREAKALRSRHSGTVFLAGLIVAGFLAIPIVNLMTPLFGAALMVHLHKAIAARDAIRDAARR